MKLTLIAFWLNAAVAAFDVYVESYALATICVLVALLMLALFVVQARGEAG